MDRGKEAVTPKRGTDGSGNVRAELKGDFISSPVRRSVLMSPPGRGWPSYFSKAGLGSKLSIVEQPPFMNRKITRLTRCG
jgi:hypothetical protein